MTPGWRMVRNFLRAFLARGRADRFDMMSNEKILQSEPSSCVAQEVSRSGRGRQAVTGALHSEGTHASGAIVQRPNGGVEVDFVAKRVRERWPLRDGRGDR